MGLGKNRDILLRICKNREEKFNTKKEMDSKFKNIFTDGGLQNYGFRNLKSIFSKKEREAYFYITCNNLIKIKIIKL
jgi:hypothetical protein